MPIQYKIDVLAALKAAGYSTYRIRQERIFGERHVQQFRQNEVTNSTEVLSKLCELLHCQPGDLVEYLPDEAAESADTL